MYKSIASSETVRKLLNPHKITVEKLPGPNWHLPFASADIQSFSVHGLLNEYIKAVRFSVASYAKHLSNINTT